VEPGLPTRTLLRVQMAKLNQPLVYLSAHTHSGFWAVHRALARQPLLELNVSSLSDRPIAYRRLSFAYDEGAKRLLLVRGELMPHGDKPSTSYADLMAAWQPETCASTGLPPDLLKEFDLTVVKQQRESRGSLMEVVAVGDSGLRNVRAAFVRARPGVPGRHAANPAARLRRGEDSRRPDARVSIAGAMR